MKYQYHNITKVPNFAKYFQSSLVASSFGNLMFAEHSSVLKHISPKSFMVPAVFCIALCNISLP